MRKPALALVIVLLAALSGAAPAAAAASPAAPAPAPAAQGIQAAASEPKVVIIVGATHGTTPKYRAYADEAYAEAVQYTSNVVKVYSPNATWERVKAAVAGASVVIYMGHGNGWPSPYTHDPNYTTKNGFGLNATAGAGDNNNKYYGEPSIATLDLAPGAVILLHHLCYAAGNSEPGHGEPSVSVARQRVDNYAAGFLKAGAAAVIADGHSGPNAYLRALFTTAQPIEQIWAGQQNANGNIVSFPSVRTPGATAFQDPRTPTSGFYRSLVVRTAGVTLDDFVTGGGGGLRGVDTSVDPPGVTVPGNAAVATDGANLFTDSAASAVTGALPAGTRLRVKDQLAAFGWTDRPVVLVGGIDDPGIWGYIAVQDLVGRDNLSPALRSLDMGAGAISPNGDGLADQALVTGTFTEYVTWNATIQDPTGYPVYQASGAGWDFQLAWNPLATGQSTPDGTYTLTIGALDGWQNNPLAATRNIVVDSTPAQLLALTPGRATTSWLSPNGDGNRETVTFKATASEPGTFAISVRDGYGTTHKSWTVTAGAGATAVAWDGRDGSGAPVADGAYVLSIAARDAAGNTGPGEDRAVNVVTALGSVTTSAPVFFPQDLDQFAPTTELAFSLSRSMVVTWTLRDAAAKVIDTHLAGVALDAGTHTWTFDGRRSDGTMLPPGRYLSHVVATDGTLVAAQSVAVEADAFLVKPSDATPARGQSITVTVTSAEPLGANPRVTISQPGLAAWSVATVRLSGTTWRATVKLKAGSTGLVTFKATGKDIAGSAQSTARGFPLH